MTFPVQFTVREPIISLVREMRVTNTFTAYPHARWVGERDFGAPCIDPWRPYGSDDVYEDIARIVGEHYDEEDGGMLKFEHEDDGKPGHNFKEKYLTRMNLLHLHTETALQILVDTLQLSVGEYEKEEGGKWVKVNS